ncbi:MAG: putative porin [Deltaproteobacteria bacterium]|nr:putative porin [Deltaproteobacteria bacterium]
MKRLLLMIACCALAAGLCASQAQAGEVDILVEKLVKKGILSKSDAEDVLKEVKEAAWQEKDQERAEIIKGAKEAVRNEIKKDPKMFADALPAWVRKMQLKGDFRLRYESTDRDDTADRNRGRYRLRLGVVTQINDQIDVGFGLASGSADPRSTNETMDNSFERGDLRLDYAYARYRPWSWLSLVGGKFENPLFRPTDMLWDSDIRPEGAAAQFTHTLNPNIDLFANTGFFIIDERSGDENDPTMYVIQPGSKIKFRSMYFKNAVALYRFDNYKGQRQADVNYSSGTNSVRKFKNTLRHDYDALVLSGEFGWKTPFARVPYASVFGEAVKNTSVGQGDSGYAVGYGIGSAKVKKRHDWQFGTRYLKLERDAWPDFLPDSDTYDGETNVKGYKTSLTYGLFENTNLCATYFNTKKISGPSLDEEKVQLDLNFKF